MVWLVGLGWGELGLMNELTLTQYLLFSNDSLSWRLKTCFQSLECSGSTSVKISIKFSKQKMGLLDSIFKALKSH